MYITRMGGYGDFIHTEKDWTLKGHLGRLAERGNLFYLYDASGVLIGVFASRSLALRRAKSL
jgi:hypothetical protein